MYARVVPSLRMPRSMGSLYYSIPPDMKVGVGEAVRISFRKSTIQGVVWEVSPTIPASLRGKKILPIGEKVRLQLTPHQLSLFQWVSDYYYSALSNILNKSLPRLGKRVFEDLPDLADSISPEVGKNPKISFYRYSSISDKIQLYHKRIHDTISKGRNVCVFFPEIFSLRQFERAWAGTTRPLVLTSELTPKQWRESWQHLYQNDVQLILATKRGVFAPLQNIGLFIVDDEESDSHKQWESTPRFHTREVVLHMASLHGCDLLLSSACPAAETFHKIITKEYAILHTQATANNFAVDISLIDLKNEIKNKNYSLISGALASEIENSLQTGKQSLLILNRKGGFKRILCRDCGWPLRCLTCGLPLEQRLNSKSEFHCHSCPKPSPVAHSCAKCGGMRLLFKGAGIEKIAQDLKNLFPSAIIKQFHAEGEQKKPFEGSDIIIATDAVVSRHEWKQVRTVAFACFDQELVRPHFRSTEHALQSIFRVWHKARHEAQAFSCLLLQTYTPEQRLFDFMRKTPLKEFYQQELKERRQLGYPPYGKLIRCVLKQPASRQGSTLPPIQAHKNLLAWIRAKGLDGKIRVFETVPESRPGHTYEYSLVIKLAYDLGDRQEHELLRLLPDEWLIDVNPLEF